MMRNYNPKRLPAAAIICLLLCIFPWGTEAQELPASNEAVSLIPKVIVSPVSQDAAKWRLSVSLFYRVSSENLASIVADEFTFAAAKELASKAGQETLSFSLPAIVTASLLPFPNRSAKEGPETAAPISVSLGTKISNGEFVDIRQDTDFFSENEGLITGFFSREGESIQCVILFFEKRSPKVLGSARFEGSIDNLEAVSAETLPFILSWVANKDKPLGIVDIVIKPTGGPMTIEVKPNNTRGVAAISGARAFIFESGSYDISIERKGYKTSLMKNQSLTTGMYRSYSVQLEPSMETLPAENSFAEAAKSLNWPDKSAFREKEIFFHSALGRLIVGVPISAIAFGAFFSYWEAYSRSAASPTALYVSGGAAALCLSVDIGFIIDTAIKLVDVLRASR